MENNAEITILGSGGMAKEIYSSLESTGIENRMNGFAIEEAYFSKQNNSEILGLPLIKTRDIKSGSSLIAAIGSPQRKKIIEELEKKFNFITVIDKTAIIGSRIEIGTGSYIGKGAILTESVEIRKHVIVNIKASISHDSKIGDYCTISPGVNIAGNVSIGSGTWVGIGASVIHNIKIGKNVFIGAGSVIVKDIPDNCLVYGVPGKVIKDISSEDFNELI